MSIMFECKKKAEVNNSQSSIESLVINNSSMKTDYIQGDTLDLTGIQIQAILGPLTIDVTQYCTFSPIDGTALTSDVASITATFLGINNSTPINVYEIDEIAVTTQPTKTQYANGETMDFNGLVVTGYANNRSFTSNITSQCTLSHANGSTISGEDGTYSVSVTFGNLSTSFSYIISSAPAWDSRGMEYNSWDTIAYYIRKGETAGKMAIGDTKTFTRSAVNDFDTTAQQFTAEVQYIGNNFADLVSKELEPVAHNISYNTYPSYADSISDTSSLRYLLNNGILNALPSELKSNIIEKTYYAQNNPSGTKETIDKLWLPTMYELHPSYPYASDETASIYYSLLDSTDGRKKYTVGNIYNYKEWWTSSQIKNRGNYYNVVGGSSGNWNNSTFGSSTGIYFPLCFRIG